MWASPVLNLRRAGGKNQDNFKVARLDRALCSSDFLDLYPSIRVDHLPQINLDHSPLLISLVNTKNGKNSFSFQAAWMSHPEFHEQIANN